MTQEDRYLLLKDLSGRLTTDVKVVIIDNPTKILYLNGGMLDLMSEGKVKYKPFLRPMSSMTDEEKEDFGVCIHIQPKRYRGYTVNCSHYYTVSEIDWLNEHHFDYRGLIEKGLAIAVTDENNPYK